MQAYFSDREFGPTPATSDVLPAPAWGALVAAFDRMADRHYFASNFPDHCPDGQGIMGTSIANLKLTLAGHVSAVGQWPRADRQPPTPAAMDFVEFAWRYAAEPLARDHHSFFGHDHFDFDVPSGQASWRDEVNLILQRNGVALTLGSDGIVSRIGPTASRLVLAAGMPSSGEARVDELLTTAITKYRDPDVVVRREALEALWDAFERVKSLLDPGDKKASVTSLVGTMTPSSAGRARLDADFRELTSIGNDFQIRHHEVAKHPVDEEMIDHWFVRTLSLVEAAIRAIDPPGPGPTQ